MALADNDTLADKSGREFVTSHCNEPLLALRHFNPFSSSLLDVSCLLKFGGGIKLASVNDLVYSS